MVTLCGFVMTSACSKSGKPILRRRRVSIKNGVSTRARRRRARGRRDVVDDDALKPKKVSTLAAARAFSGDGRPKSCEARTGEACVAGLRHRCEAVAARASAHKTLGQSAGGGGHLGAARGREAARRHAIRLARLIGSQHQIRGHFTSRSACVWPQGRLVRPELST